MPRVATSRLKFFYQQAGSGPDVVLIHGVTGNLAIWPLINLIDILAADFRVTAYDLRGHGYSDTPLTNYTSEDMAHDFAAIHAALDLKPAYVLGHSFGGIVAMHAAVLYPERVAGLILSDPYYPALRHLETDIANWHGWQEFKDFTNRAGMDIDVEAWWDVGKFIRSAANLTQEQAEAFRREVGPQALQRLLRLVPTTCGQDTQAVAGLTEEKILSVKQPVLCLYGEESPFLNTCYYLEKHLSDCKVALVPRAKHRAHEENPEGYVDLVQKHLQEMAGIAGTWKENQATPAGGIPCA
jgi:pimeloyl-ACP methyl ester carboxylesterase